MVGRIVHPRKYIEVRRWLADAALEHEILVSEVCDYELRRELIRIGATRSLARLDELGRELRYVPVTTGERVRACYTAYMGSRREERERRERHRAWVRAHGDELSAIGLPLRIFESAERWADFVENGHLHWHEDVERFSFDDLSVEQRGTLHRSSNASTPRGSECSRSSGGFVFARRRS